MDAERDRSLRRHPGERGRSAIATAFPALVLACGALAVAGCDIGGEEPDPTAAEEPQRSGDRDARGDDPAEPSDDVARQIREACHEIADRAPGMPERVRREVIAECDEAAADDAEAARTAAGAACEAFAAATAPWPLRGAVADACRRALPEPTGL